MYLAQLAHGHRLRGRILLRVIRLFSPAAIPDIVHVLLYRPWLFGRPFSRLVQRLLRGPSPWSVGERELLGAFVAKLNACRF